MDNGRWILCRNCDAVHHVTSFDKAAAYALSTAEAKNIPADDWRAFMDQHAGHSLEPLKASDGPYFPTGLPSDPMAVAYLKVTDGREEFLLRRSRSSIAEPLRFERIEGLLSDQVAPAPEIQEREIRRELALRFRHDDGESLSAEKVDLFIRLFRAEVGKLQAGKLTAAERSYDNDNISYAAIPAATRDSLLEQCAGCFSSAEAQALRRFIEAHGYGSDVMTLVVRRRIFVTEAGNRQ